MDLGRELRKARVRRMVDIRDALGSVDDVLAGPLLPILSDLVDEVMGMAQDLVDARNEAVRP